MTNLKFVSMQGPRKTNVMFTAREVLKNRRNSELLLALVDLKNGFN